ncbi:hypothetical protein MUU53_20690 [Rhizobium lemnae]|uniref:DUF983 domain-containing protein n=1 Tax=Rhizobium lemnae TaxID=1214924 RepID=A0ABV8EEM4_9HYPH|nr:hypothetical protein [Rhizobium lemnae]MCJ8510308.1 hypothetical protein [Rhizobium lemnae]
MALKSPVRMKPEIIKREHRYAAEALRGALAHDRAACPRCGSGSLMLTADKEVRRCDGCGSSVSLDELARHHGAWLSATARQRQDHFRRSARIFVQFALVWLLVTIPWSAYARSGDMLIVAGIITFLAFVGFVAMRYRAWQAATGRHDTKVVNLSDF